MYDASINITITATDETQLTFDGVGGGFVNLAAEARTLVDDLNGVNSSAVALRGGLEGLTYATQGVLVPTRDLFSAYSDGITTVDTLRTSVASLTDAYGAQADTLSGLGYAYDGQLSRYTDLTTASGALVTANDAITVSIQGQAAAYTALATARDLATGSGDLSTLGGGLGSTASRDVTQVAEQDSGLALRTGVADFTSSGGLRLGAGGIGVAGGSGLLGAATIPVVAAALGGYAGFKAEDASNTYNQSVTDVVGSSSQNADLIPQIQQGILDLVGGSNRFNASQLMTAAYPVASDPTFGNSDSTFLDALRIISALGHSRHSPKPMWAPPRPST